MIFYGFAQGFIKFPFGIKSYRTSRVEGYTKSDEMKRTVSRTTQRAICFEDFSVMIVVHMFSFIRRLPHFLEAWL